MTAPRPTVRERLQYSFDSWMSRGTGAIMALLALATLVFVVVLGLAAWIMLRVWPDDINVPGDDPSDLLWDSLMRTLDPGTMGGDQGWAFRLMMLLVTIGGLVIVASLIGIVSGAFDAKIAALRQGRSRVIESGHTLILGWSPKVFTIIAELAIANESERRSVIVVLSPEDKIEMEQAVRDEVGATGRTKVICRSGDPMSLIDLELGSPHTARSVVILAPEGDDDPDSTVIRTVLALTNNPRRRDERYHLVGELRDASNLEAARLVGRDEADWVLASEFINRVTVQTCRQSGLSAVYTDLLDFDGDEIYFTRQPGLVGKTYAEVQASFPRAAVIGYVSRDAVMLNPTADSRCGVDDEIIVIAEDDSTIAVGEPGAADESVLVVPDAADPAPERTIVLGMNRGVIGMLDELDEYVAAGSTALLVSTEPLPELPAMRNLRIEHRDGDPTSRALLDDLAVQEADHIIVLAEKEHLSPSRADARTLITLLHLRDIAERLETHLNVVTEMLDDRNRELAEVTNADDYIVSDKLVSLMLSQIAENPRLSEVFDQMISSDGNEIYLRPANDYIRAGESADFYTVMAAARRRGETAIGYRIAADAQSASRRYGVRINPHKAARVAFAPEDRVIVLAEEAQPAPLI